LKPASSAAKLRGPGSFADAGHVYVHIRTGVIGEQVGGGKVPYLDHGVGLLKIWYQQISWNLGGSSTFCLSISQSHWLINLLPINHGIFLGCMSTFLREGNLESSGNATGKPYFCWRFVLTIFDHKHMGG